jgi:DNA-binding protein H-NS
MRKPRDIDAELRALAERAKSLKNRRVSQLGELVIATGADELDLETLAGVLLAAVSQTETSARADWRRRGAIFFRERGAPARPRREVGGDGEGATQDHRDPSQG